MYFGGDGGRAGRSGGEGGGGADGTRGTEGSFFLAVVRPLFVIRSQKNDGLGGWPPLPYPAWFWLFLCGTLGLFCLLLEYPGRKIHPLRLPLRSLDLVRVRRQ